MKKISVFILIVFLGFIQALPQAHAEGASYKKVLKKWTRTDEVYRSDDFLASIIWSVTLLNDEMLKAQAVKYAKQYRLSGEERRGHLDEAIEKRDGNVLFFISFYSADRRYNDLNNPRAHWDLRLEAGGQHFEPVKIEKISRLTPLEIMFYPYVTPWSTGYYVWFPGEALAYPRPWKLSVTNPLSRSSLTWE